MLGATLQAGAPEVRTRTGKLAQIFADDRLPFSHRKPVSWEITVEGGYHWSGGYWTLTFQFPVEDIEIPSTAEFLALPNAVGAHNVFKVGTSVYDGSGTVLENTDGLVTYTTVEENPLIFADWVYSRYNDLSPYLQTTFAPRRWRAFEVTPDFVTFPKPSFRVNVRPYSMLYKPDVSAEDICEFLNGGGLDHAYEAAAAHKESIKDRVVCSGTF